MATRSSECPRSYESITCTVNLAIAIQRGNEELQRPGSQETSEGPRNYSSPTELEAPGMQKCYLIEYNLLPDDPKPNKARLLVFGKTAKLYLGNEIKILSPWEEGNQVWLAWSQSVKILVTRDTAIKMASHRITFRLWNIKSMALPKAKSSARKGFWGSEERNDNDFVHPDGIKKIVQNLRYMSEKESPKSFIKEQTESTIPSDRKPSKLHSHSLSVPDVEDMASECIDVNSAENKGMPRDRGEDHAIRDSCSLFEKIKPVAQRATQKSITSASHTRKIEVAFAKLSPGHLFAGKKNVTEYLVVCAPGITEGICNISIDKPFLSDELKAELNPLVITILSATSLPDSPVPFHILEEKCEPVYCEYKFHTFNVHRTEGQKHGSKVIFRDVSVVLTGLMTPGELREYLQGPPLEIEVHDRDRKPVNRPAEFVPVSHGDQLCSMNSLISKEVTHKPFQKHGMSHSLCGIARVDLSDLLCGLSSFKVTVPIMCSRKTREGKDSKHESPYVADTSLVDMIPMANYLDANSQLKVKIEIANPLTKLRNEPSTDCPFGRIIYIFRYDSSTVTPKLRSEILKINAAALQIDSYTEKEIEKHLSCRKMMASQRKKDIISGFYLCDQKFHLFVLEGLRDKAIQGLLETIPTKLSRSAQEQVEILYSSELSFSKRLYDKLDMSLAPIYLKEPLECIMKQPYVYLRGRLPHACFQALSRISFLLCTTKMKDVIHNGLLPSAEMLLSMRQEYGSICCKGDEEIKTSNNDEPQASSEGVKAKIHTPLDNYNPEYVKQKQLASQELCMERSYVKANIEEVHQASQRLQKEKPAVMVPNPAVGKVAHNYSIQTENSTMQAWEQLRNELGKEPKRRFTYSQEYQSATVVPVDTEKEQKASEAKSKAAWMTPNGFEYPGWKSSIESNEHPEHPDEARIEELRKPWKENILHDNKLKPPLTRDLWSWSKRHQDFQCYLKPSSLFDREAPLSINLAGEALRQEQLEVAKAQYDRWLQKVLVNRDFSKVGPVPEFKCHMVRGKSGKLEGLLKDKPMRYSLKNPKMALKPIPAVSVIHQSVPGSEDTKQGVCKSFVPGPLTEHSLWSTNNHIPLYKSDSNQFRLPRSRSFLYKRSAPPLTVEEQHAYPFHQPLTTPKLPPIRVQTQSARNVMQTRTHKNLFVHVI